MSDKLNNENLDNVKDTIEETVTENVTDNTVVENVEKTLDTAKESLENTLETTKKKATETFEDVKEVATEKFEEAKEKVSETAENVKHVASETVSEAKEKVTETFAAVSNNVEVPVTFKKSKLKYALIALVLIIIAGVSFAFFGAGGGLNINGFKLPVKPDPKTQPMEYLTYSSYKTMLSGNTNTEYQFALNLDDAKNNFPNLEPATLEVAKKYSFHLRTGAKDIFKKADDVKLYTEFAISRENKPVIGFGVLADTKNINAIIPNLSKYMVNVDIEKETKGVSIGKYIDIIKDIDQETFDAFVKLTNESNKFLSDYVSYEGNSNGKSLINLNFTLAKFYEQVAKPEYIESQKNQIGFIIDFIEKKSTAILDLFKSSKDYEKLGMTEDELEKVMADSKANLAEMREKFSNDLENANSEIEALPPVARELLDKIVVDVTYIVNDKDILEHSHLMFDIGGVKIVGHLDINNKVDFTIDESKYEKVSVDAGQQIFFDVLSNTDKIENFNEIQNEIGYIFQLFQTLTQ